MTDDNQVSETVETGITEGGRSGAFRDVLSKNHARRGKPPVHFADLTPMLGISQISPRANAMRWRVNSSRR